MRFKSGILLTSRRESCTSFRSSRQIQRNCTISSLGTWFVFAGKQLQFVTGVMFSRDRGHVITRGMRSTLVGVIGESELGTIGI